MSTPKYYRRFKQDGTPFYISESGSEVPEATAKTNLMTERTMRETFAEDTFAESARSRARAGSTDAKAKMEEAFARFAPRATDTGKTVKTVQSEAGGAKTSMEEAFERFAVTRARAPVA